MDCRGWRGNAGRPVGKLGQCPGRRRCGVGRGDGSGVKRSGQIQGTGGGQSQWGLMEGWLWQVGQREDSLSHKGGLWVTDSSAR